MQPLIHFLNAAVAPGEVEEVEGLSAPLALLTAREVLVEVVMLDGDVLAAGHQVDRIPGRRGDEVHDRGRATVELLLAQGRDDLHADILQEAWHMISTTFCK